jgi:hypothetical protein
VSGIAREQTLSNSSRRGIFALIRNRQDALNVVTDTSIVFLLAAGILAALYLIEGERTLLDVGLFAFFAGLLWRFKSPAAAIALLLVSVMRLFVTLAQILDTGEVNWIFVAITAVVIVTSIRAAEATLKLIGRFQVPAAPDERT